MASLTSNAVEQRENNRLRRLLEVQMFKVRYRAVAPVDKVPSTSIEADCKYN